jgi:hypothetical protein
MIGSTSYRDSANPSPVSSVESVRNWVIITRDVLEGVLSRASGIGPHAMHPAQKEEMSVVHGAHVIEDDRPIALLRLEEPAQPDLPIFAKVQKEFLLVATVGNVPCTTQEVISARSSHAAGVPSA